MKSKITLKALLLSCAAALAWSEAAALQLVDGDGRVQHTVKVSSHEMTRIAIDGAKMSGFRFALDELEVDQDKSSGAVYVKPLVKDKNINVFVSGAYGLVHELILVPTAGLPLDSIVIKEPVVRAKTPPAATPSSTVDRANSTDLAIKRLLRAMAGDNDTVPELNCELLNKPINLWTQVSFVELKNCTSNNFSVSSYRLRNTSTEMLRMAEQEFYAAGVLAVSIEHHVLQPREETSIFVIRTGATK